ncbi:peroxiredoxin family protein [Alteribacter natronophilus]|uniref:peroxiredoxin family protein n=1 Tax=Alteribacter natronophilus TaxID=2583810 RepID=UPI00110DE323|nr:redoxin domain-containing protein [Alteribacter natronophilus]TMW72734.1 redoxin domain-containing protein [Alteribacter natronophilus]
MAELKLGRHTPNVSLQEVSAEKYDLESDMKQRPGWRFLVFIRGAWCPVCVEELKKIQAQHAEFNDHDVHFTCISTDGEEDLLRMKKEHDFPFPVLADQKRQALKDYGVHYHESGDAPYEDHGDHGEAACFLLDEEGRLLYQHKQTSPFGRPDPEALMKIVQYIRKNKKEFETADSQVKKPNMPY